jgi:diacylglycerol kinase family enzyme
LNEVANGLNGRRVPVAVLASGTANLVAMEFGLTRDPIRLARAMVRGTVRTLDLARWGESRFLVVAGAGFDAAVTTDVAQRRRGPITKLTWVPSIARALRRYRFPRLRVRVDGREVTPAGTGVVVANMASYGGPFSVAPQADPTDGLLDVCVTTPDTPFTFTMLMAAGAAGFFRNMPGVLYRRGRQVTVESAVPVPLQVDGEAAGATPASFAIEDAAFELILSGEG